MKFKPGEKVVYHHAEIFTSLVTVVEEVEGWIKVQFKDHTDANPSETIVRPSRLIPLTIGHKAIFLLNDAFWEAMSANEHLRAENIFNILSEVLDLSGLGEGSIAHRERRDALLEALQS